MFNRPSSDTTTSVNSTPSKSAEVNGTSDNNAVTNNKSDNSATTEGKSGNGAATDSATADKNTSANKSTSEKAEVEIGSGEGAAESTVTVPINVKSVPENGIGSCNFSVKYDASILEAVEVIPGDLIGKNTSNLDYSILDSTGIVSFLFASSNDGKDSISKSGELVKIKFKIKKDAKKGLTKITKELNGVFGDTSLKKVDAVFTQGGITIK